MPDLPDTPPTLSFEDDLDRSFQGVRGALTELLSSVDADPTRPQDLARRFGINKNLAWKISRIIMSGDPRQMISNLPGDAGVKTILTAFEKHGAPAAVIGSTQRAVEEFDRMVEDHVDDRSTLNLVLTSSSPDRVPQEHLHATRKLAYQGNSAIWGIQARVRMASFFIAPNGDDPTMVDTVSVGGLLDVRRLRENVGIPLFMRFSYNDDGTIRSGSKPEPLCEYGDTEDELMLIPEFCSGNAPKFRKIERQQYSRYMLNPGPIGNHGCHSWVFGECDRKFASIYADEHNTVGEHAVPIMVPTEWLLCDLQVHKDFDFAQDPSAIAHVLINADPAPSDDLGDDLLPISETVQSIGGSPPVVATPLIPHYPMIVNRVYRRMGWDSGDFHGYRFVMKYPPMSTCVVIQHGLRERPSSTSNS